MRKRRVERAATPNLLPPFLVLAPPPDNKSNLQQGRSGRLRSTQLFRPTPQQQSLPLVQDGRSPLAPSSFSLNTRLSCSPPPRAPLARLFALPSSSDLLPPTHLFTRYVRPSTLASCSLAPRPDRPALDSVDCLVFAPARRSSSRSGGVLSSAHPTDQSLRLSLRPALVVDDVVLLVSLVRSPTSASPSVVGCLDCPRATHGCCSAPTSVV